MASDRDCAQSSDRRQVWRPQIKSSFCARKLALERTVREHLYCGDRESDAGAFGLHYATLVRRDSTTNEVIDGDDFYVVGRARKSFEAFECRAIRLRIAPGT